MAGNRIKIALFFYFTIFILKNKEITMKNRKNTLKFI